MLALLLKSDSSNLPIIAIIISITGILINFWFNHRRDKQARLAEIDKAAELSKHPVFELVSVEIWSTKTTVKELGEGAAGFNPWMPYSDSITLNRMGIGPYSASDLHEKIFEISQADTTVEYLDNAQQYELGKPLMNSDVLHNFLYERSGRRHIELKVEVKNVGTLDAKEMRLHLSSREYIDGLNLGGEHKQASLIMYSKFRDTATFNILIGFTDALNEPLDIKARINLFCYNALHYEWPIHIKIIPIV